MKEQRAGRVDYRTGTLYSYRHYYFGVTCAWRSKIYDVRTGNAMIT